MGRISAIGVMVNATKPRAAAALAAVSAFAERNGVSLLASPETVAIAGGGGSWIACPPEVFAAEAPCVVVLGGDGTILRAVHTLADLGMDVPIMGLNIGSLGYLTCADEDRFDEALEALCGGTCEIVPRQTLECEIRHGRNTRKIGRLALNEVVLSRGSGRIVRLGLSLDGRDVAEYACDGLIVSTPTGSTAYSMSAGGPLVMPGTAATVITVICPHALSSRPLVVSDSTVVGISPLSAETPLVLDIDGECAGNVSVGETVRICKGARSVRIAFLPGEGGHRVLKRKLGWTDGGEQRR